MSKPGFTAAVGFYKFNVCKKTRIFCNGLKNPNDRASPSVGLFHPLEIFLGACALSALGKFKYDVEIDNKKAYPVGEK